MMFMDSVDDTARQTDILRSDRPSLSTPGCGCMLTGDQPPASLSAKIWVAHLFNN